ncbi:metallophosphoesterase [Falsiroseomonas sp.]|uniref:metallophosphoesterase n=1 Tax=Falsiroseomonas sp. TaxID=2870721 RepID=UPI003568431D
MMFDDVRHAQASLGGVQLRIAVIADTHLEAETGVALPRSNRRTRAAVGWIRALAPGLVVHLGDVVHPLPALPDQDAAFAAATEIFAPLAGTMLITPGNHDIGDKPNPAMPAAAARAAWAEGWVRRSGPLWQSHRVAGCRIVLVCASLFGSATQAEEAQWDWLGQELAAARAADERVFLFTHYPPFVRDPAEPGHYDNLDAAPRARLLELARQHGVEAILSGHAHAFFLNRVGDTLLHVVPSVAFARRDYAELSRVAPAPEEEFGRNEPGRLGFAVLDVLVQGHALHPVPTEGTEDPAPPPGAFVGLGIHPRRGQAPLLGVPLHHPWSELVALPTNPPTAPFRRRLVRDDRTVQLLWRLGLSRLRIPLDDLEDPVPRARVALLAREGFRFWLATQGVPGAALLDLLVRDAALLEGWEIVLPEADIAAAGAVLCAVPAGRLPARRVLAPMLSTATRPGAAAAALFVGAGLPPDQAPDALRLAPAGAFSGWMARIGRGMDVASGIAAVAERASVLGCEGAVTICLSPTRPDESWTDDEAIAQRILAAAEGAARHNALTVWTDTLLDIDRGYFVRNGLADRRMRPRAAGLALARRQAELPTVR